MADDTVQTPKLKTADDKSEDSSDNKTTQNSCCHLGSPVQYRNAREYAQALKPWLWQYYSTLASLHYWTSVKNIITISPPCFQSGSYTSAPQTSGRQQTTGSGNTAQATGRLSPPVQRFQGQECVIPPFWKRVSAELIDFTILFYIKLLVTVVVMHRMGFMEGIFDYDLLENLEEIDYDRAFTITSEVIAMEIINRLLITFFEMLCLRQGIGTVGGATPGKRLLGLRVISCQEIRALGNSRVLVSPASDIGWFSAFVRSAIKNFTIAFFFPACLTVFIFKHNRAAYDVLSNSIVVEAEEL